MGDAIAMFYDGDDNDDNVVVPEPQDGGVQAGDYNLGDEAGTRIGEGHDPIEDPIQ